MDAANNYVTGVIYEVDKEPNHGKDVDVTNYAKLYLGTGSRIRLHFR